MSYLGLCERNGKAGEDPGYAWIPTSTVEVLSSFRIWWSLCSDLAWDGPHKELSTLSIPRQFPCRGPPISFVTLLVKQMAKATAGHRKVNTRPTGYTCSLRTRPLSIHKSQMVGTGCHRYLARNWDQFFQLLISSSIMRIMNRLFS